MIHITIDETNPFYILLKTLGCDLMQETIGKYDCFILGLQFLFAVFMLGLFCKFFYNVFVRMTRCASAV